MLLSHSICSSMGFESVSESNNRKTSIAMHSIYKIYFYAIYDNDI